MSSFTNRQVSGQKSCVIKKEVRTIAGESSQATQWETVTKETVTTEGGRQVRTVVTTSTSGSGPSDMDDLRHRFEKGFKGMEEKNALPSSVGTSKQTGKKAAPGSSKGTANEKDFAKQVLESHNMYRAKHGVPPLQLSDTLNKYAKEWVEKLAQRDAFEHRQNNKYGENIFMKWSSDPSHQISGNEPADSWYSEIKDHTFGQEPRTLKSGHFSQMIWRESKQMGVARAKSKSGKILVVANYDPAGNMMGKFATSVPPPKK